MLKLSVILEVTLEFIEVRAAERKRRKELRSDAQSSPPKGRRRSAPPSSQ